MWKTDLTESCFFLTFACHCFNFEQNESLTKNKTKTVTENGFDFINIR